MIGLRPLSLKHPRFTGEAATPALQLGKKTLILLNPRANGGAAKATQKQVRDLAGQYPDAKIAIESPNGIDSLNKTVADYAPEISRAIAVGGDGSINRVVQAAMPFPHIDVGIIPQGTGNRLAYNLGIPTRVPEAMKVAMTGEPFVMDLGKFNERIFTFAAGAGADAFISKYPDPLTKRILKVAAYFIPVARLILRPQVNEYTVQVDDAPPQTFKGLGVMFANFEKLIGNLTLTPGAKPDDGEMDLAILSIQKRRQLWGAWRKFRKGDFTASADSPGILHLRGKKFTITCDPKVPTEVDGDDLETTRPIRIETLPKALRVLIPKKSK